VEIDKLRSLIGRETPWVEAVVERHTLERFLTSSGDTVPPFRMAGRTERWEHPIVPPGYLAAMRPDASELQIPDVGSVRLNAGNEFEWLTPVQAGEVLERKTKLADVFEREGKSGKMVFFVLETTYRRPGGQVVAMARATTIRR
jgi:acyl dehydratase